MWCVVQAGQTNLVECQSYELDLDLTRMGTNPLAQAPYYFMAYPANGVPTVTPLGDDIKKMKWAVDFPSGRNHSSIVANLPTDCDSMLLSRFILVTPDRRREWELGRG